MLYDINCEFEPSTDGDGKFVCKLCKLKVKRQDIQSNCRAKTNDGTIKDFSSFIPNKAKVSVQTPKSELKPPTLLNRIVNFTAAAAAHAIAGNPVVTEEVLQERLAICKACELFKPNENAAGGVCTHASCGCNIQDNLNYLNKIAWADQKCPIDKWGPSDGV